MSHVSRQKKRNSNTKPIVLLLQLLLVCVCVFFHKRPIAAACVYLFSEKPHQQWQEEFPPLDAKKVPLGQ